MSLPPNFGQAFDLSSLTKPKVDPSTPMPGIQVTVENLSTEILPLSLVRPVIILMWSPRSPESIEMVKTLGKLENDYKVMEALESGDYIAAEAAYKKWLARKPAENLAKLGLAQTQLLIRTEGLDLHAVVAESAAEPTNIDLQMKAADVEIVNGGVEAAFTRLLSAVRASTGDDRAKVKNHLLNLFALVDPSDPRLTAARKELASALF